MSRRLSAILRRPLILAGGLTPANVRSAIETVRPAGVDAHTGVEGPDGGKDRALVRAFVTESRAAFRDARPSCIRHYREIQSEDDAHYPGSRELLSIGSPFGAVGGLERIGVHHEILPPGRRTSWPHAESTEEEFVFVLEGNPEVWLDGHVYPLSPGDGVTFPAGTGISHTFLNRTTREARLLVVGERRRDNQVYYPLHPERREQIGEQWWEECPRHELGPDRAEP